MNRRLRRFMAAAMRPQSVRSSHVLSGEHLKRFKRQYILPEIGRAGQARLAEARVLLVGLGGLGSISANYLTAAGVGSIRIVDGDVVALDKR